MFDHLLESSHRDDSNEWSNIGFGEEITQVDMIEFSVTHLIWSNGIIKQQLIYATAAFMQLGHTTRCK